MKQKMSYEEAKQYEEKLQTVVKVLSELSSHFFVGTGILGKQKTRPYAELLREFEPELRDLVNDRLNKRNEELGRLRAAIKGLEIEFETEGKEGPQ